MGTNVSKSVNTIIQEIDNELKSSTSASSNIKCDIEVGNIVLRKSKGCSVELQNRCGANANAALDSIATAATDAFQTASADLQTKLLPGVNVNDSKESIKSNIRNKLQADCQTDASAALKIATGALILEDCENSTIKNINTGSVEANCGIRMIVDAVEKAKNEVKAEASTGDLDLSKILYGDNLLYGSIVSVACVICCILICAIIGIVMIMRS